MPSSPTHDAAPSVPRRALRAVLTATATFATIAAACAAILVGAQWLTARATGAPLPDPAGPVAVAVRPLAIEVGFDVPRRVLGRVEPAAEVALAFERGGRLVALEAEEGDRVARGAVIARLDTALLEAERDRLDAARAATRARLDFAESRLARSEALAARGFASQDGREAARATRDELAGRIAELDAALAGVAINLEKSVLTAPFEARVAARDVDPGGTLSAGQPVLTLVADAAPRLRVGLPLDLDPAALAGATVVIDGVAHPAELIALRPDIDPVTRTRTALFALPDATGAAFGQIGALGIAVRVAAEGAWVPLDALREGREGAWSVLVVADGVVRQAAVEILHAEAGRAFVRGSFAPGMALVATGAHRVVPGQRVVARPLPPAGAHLGAEG